ncbi:MAG: hypothetical protein Kow0074_04690 [Candidatus Zixiibacteriota bacterium]
MTDMKHPTPERWLWRVIALVWLCCGVYGAYTLLSSEREMIRFWDEADLVLDIAVPEFATEGGRIGGISYATRKIGYAFPVKIFYDTFGRKGFAYYNFLWFAVFLLIPIPDTRRYWLAWVLRIAVVLSLPYTMKYVTMLNPTLQSMALWLLLASLMVWWRRFRNRRQASYWLLTASVGVTGGLLVLTDFKWLAFVGAGLLLCLVWDQWSTINTRPQSARSYTAPLKSLIIDAASSLIWVPIVMLLAAVLHPPYADMIYAMMFAMPGKLGVLRWDLCSNVFMHLWFLGGFGVIVGATAITLLQRRIGLALQDRYAPFWIIPTLIIAVFTIVLWPRGARMYVPAIVLIIQFGCIALVAMMSRPLSRPVRVGLWTSTLVMTVSLVLNVPNVRTALDTPTGLDELKANIVAHIPHWTDDDAGTIDLPYDPPLLAGYFTPVMIVRASGNRDVSWFSPKDGLLPEANWAVTNPALDHFTVLEQASSREAPPTWEIDPFFVIKSMHRLGVTVDSFPAPFYTTPYYICETTFESGHLRETLLAHPKSIWQVRYIGTIYGRPFPGDDAHSDSLRGP